MHRKAAKAFVLYVLFCGFTCAWIIDVAAQRNTAKKPARKTQPAPQNELVRLREEFVKATREYKASLEKLLAIYEGNVTKAEEKLKLSQKLLAEGLIAKAQVEENERALAAAKDTAAQTRRQMTSADEQIAGVLVETAADEQISKDFRLSKQRLVRT